MGSIPRSGISPGVGNGNPLQYSCLENSMDLAAWHNWACTGKTQDHFYFYKRRSQYLILQPLQYLTHVKAFSVLLIFFTYLLLFFLALLGLCCCLWAFSSCSETGLLSSCGSRASYWDVFSCCRAQALEFWGSAELLQGTWDLPRSGIKTHVPFISRWIPNQWITSEIQQMWKL